MIYVLHLQYQNILNWCNNSHELVCACLHLLLINMQFWFELRLATFFVWWVWWKNTISSFVFGEDSIFS